MQKKKVTRALQAVGQYPGKALFIAKPKKLITAMENLLDLADMCGLTVADEDAARYTQDGLPQKLASSLKTGLKADYNKFQPLIKAIRDEINKHGEGCFLSWESEAEREQREKSEQLKANLTTTTQQQQQQSPPGLLIWQQALRDEMQNQMQALYIGQAGVPPRLLQRQRRGYEGSNAAMRQQPWPCQRQELQQQFNQQQQWRQQQQHPQQPPQQHLRPRNAPPALGDKEKITSGPLQQQQQEKTTPGSFQQQQFGLPEAKITFRSHPIVIQPNQMKTQKNQSQYDDRIYIDSCASDTILCRDRIEPRRIVWEKLIELTMGVSDERAEGIQIRSYGVVRIGGVDEITGALGEVDVICYLTKPGERMKHLLRGKGLVFDDGLPGPLSGRNYVIVTDADGEGRRLRITQPFGDGRSNLPFFVMCPLLSPPLLAAPTVEVYAFVKKVLTQKKQILKQAGADTNYRLLTDPTKLKAWHARFGHCNLSRLVATLRERQVGVKEEVRKNFQGVEGV
uniref:Uncharacterized protein n=1 Tax=Chromera velia CCMP2878 TaxID=1169474 RepID=A0A0G4H2S7_9ALVE|eukprot:Cvel_5595.t1-p1 / transcript=Cvel_5595.t1 / gene=Cvel_5595 / organism=Chromera_velia_CCMP2878 / gene_product=hypothetical protein / transcript_product=hypothetical protein / location=Cvel_scaffold263:72686-74641(+) / protein_length=509 / sequence_SO=supercontig / SO=protein_coding / is_pseudo=false